MASILLFIFPVPIIGILVRYRASYHPKIQPVIPSSSAKRTVQLPEAGFTSETPVATNIDGQINTLSKPVVAQIADLEMAENIGLQQVQVDAIDYDEPKPTFRSVFKKIWREDQFEGLFKGCFPTVFFLFFITLSFRSFRCYVSPAPVTNMSDFKILPVANCLYIILLVGTYRTIVSPHKIRLGRPKEAFRLIFKEYERRHVLRFYQYSGLIPPFLIGIFLDFFVSRSISKSLGDIGPLFDHYEDEWWKVFHHPARKEWIKFLLYLLSAVVTTIISTPLDVIVTRLAIQPVTNKLTAGSAAENVPESSGELRVSGTSPRSLFNFTTEFRPYDGCIDCLRRIIKEEGWGTLYRGWWLTFLGIWWPILR